LAELDSRALLETLLRNGVEFVVVGAVAAIAQGYPLTTLDLDVTPSRDAENVERIAGALAELDAKLRVSTGEPVLFPTEPRFLRDVLSWTLETRLGDLDLVFEPAGTGGFEDLKRDALDVDLGDGVVVSMASLRDVIRMKEAAGREKDQAQLPALRRTLELIRERERRSKA
jgi:hypothetical protein